MAHRAPILGRLDRDLVCAVALALVEYPQVIVNLEAVTLLDARMQPLGTEPGGLGGNDPLDTLTRGLRHQGTRRGGGPGPAGS